MVRVMVCVLDKKAELYGNVILQANEEVAVRTFNMEVTRQSDDNPMYLHPVDFALVLVGRYDDVTGLVEPVFPPRVLRNGVKP